MALTENSSRITLTTQWICVITPMTYKFDCNNTELFFVVSQKLRTNAMLAFVPRVKSVFTLAMLCSMLTFFQILDLSICLLIWKYCILIT
jgi:hypothetical protein